MFITVDGFNKTGIPSTLWDLIEPHAQIDRVSGIAILALVILALSNLASNVPTGIIFLASILVTFCTFFYCFLFIFLRGEKEEEKKGY